MRRGFALGLVPLLGSLACNEAAAPLVDGGTDAGVDAGDSGFLAAPANTCPGWVTEQTPYPDSATNGAIVYNTYIDGSYILGTSPNGLCLWSFAQTKQEFALQADGGLDCEALCCPGCDRSTGANCNCYDDPATAFCCLEVRDGGQLAACQHTCS